MAAPYQRSDDGDMLTADATRTAQRRRDHLCNAYARFIESPDLPMPSERELAPGEQEAEAEAYSAFVHANVMTRMDWTMRPLRFGAEREEILAAYDAEWRDQSYEFRGFVRDTGQGDFSELVSTFFVATAAPQPGRCPICHGYTLPADGSCPVEAWLRDHKYIKTLF